MSSPFPDNNWLYKSRKINLLYLCALLFVWRIKELKEIHWFIEHIFKSSFELGIQKKWYERIYKKDKNRSPWPRRVAEIKSHVHQYLQFSIKWNLWNSEREKKCRRSSKKKDVIFAWSFREGFFVLPLEEWIELLHIELGDRGTLWLGNFPKRRARTG